MGPSDGCHMAKLPSLIIAAAFGLKRCLCVPRRRGVALTYILASCVGMMETECGLTLSSPRQPAEVRRWVLQLKPPLFSSLLCESGQTVRQLKTWTQSVLMPCTALKWAVVGTVSGLCLFDEPGRAELVIHLGPG